MELSKTAVAHSIRQSSDYVSTDADKEIYTEDFLLERPLLRAIRTEVPQILLIDEIDKSDEEFESFLLKFCPTGKSAFRKSEQ